MTDPMRDYEKRPLRVAFNKAPYPYDLEDAVKEFNPSGILDGWVIRMADDYDRGQGCLGLTLLIYPNVPDSYHPENHVNTVFTYPVPAANFNRESWEEWLWARIEDVTNHERSEGFRFVDEDGKERRPFKPAHPDGWDPSVVRTVVSETVTNTPNAGRLVEFPCYVCTHNHKGRMGEHFRISADLGCTQENCCGPI